MNPEKLQSVQQKLEAFLAQEKEQKERAQRCFVSYLRSVYLMKNKEVFDVFKLQLHEYALSLGLAVAPRVRFLNKAQAQRAEKGGEREEEQSEEEEELRNFKTQLTGMVPREENQSSEPEDSSEEEEEESSNEQDVHQPKTLVLDAADDDEDDEDLRDLDLLTVKRKDVFNLTGDEKDEAEPDLDSKKKTEKETKYKEAKKILKRNFQVNTKVTFNEQGQALQLWPPVQRAVTGEDEDEEEQVSGINVEKAKERLKREDQEFDKQEYSRKVKAKHREKRLKAKEARREASKRKGQESDEEDEVLAYLANNSEDEFDPSTLPDPDKLRSDEDEEEEEEDQMRSAKRQHSSESSGEEEEEVAPEKRKKRSEPKDEHTALDTGLSLAEDEELVLHLLGGRS